MAVGKSPTKWQPVIELSGWVTVPHDRAYGWSGVGLSSIFPTCTLMHSRRFLDVLNNIMRISFAECGLELKRPVSLLTNRSTSRYYGSQIERERQGAKDLGWRARKGIGQRFQFGRAPHHLGQGQCCRPWFQRVIVKFVYGSGWRKTHARYTIPERRDA